jgi:Skp family chaperone for outer membrane proteins
VEGSRNGEFPEVTEIGETTDMKIYIIMFLAFLCAAVTPNTSALAAEGGVKIATMDLKKVLEVSTIGQVVQAKVKKKYDEYQATLSKKEEELVALQGEIEKKRTVWSEDVLNQKDRELKRGIQDLQTDTKYADNDMQEYQKK